MSDTMGTADQFAQGLESSQEPAPDSIQQDPTQSSDSQNNGQPEVKLSSYAQNYLNNNVPEAERAVIMRHLAQVDSDYQKGFTQYAQQQAQIRRQYEELGSPEELRTATTLYQQFINDPASIGEFLVQNGYYTPAQQSQALQQAGLTQGQANQVVGQVQGGQPQQQQPTPQQQALPPEVTQRFERYEKALGGMFNQIQAQQEAAAQAQADAQLDSQLQELADKHGNFDLRYVLGIVQATHMPLEQAVLEYKNAVQAAVDARRAPAAPNVMGSSSMPPMAKSPKDMNSDERVAAISAAVRSMQNG